MQNINSQDKCKRRCAKDPDCYSFHYYLLDPWGITNCWIWNKDVYGPNGSEKAFCFVKDGGLIEDDVPEITEEKDLSVAFDKDRKVPDKSM